MWLYLKENSITYVHSSTFRNNSSLRELDMSGNHLIYVDLQTFVSNRELEWLDLKNNNIFGIHLSTFRNNCKLKHLDMSGNKLTFLDLQTFSSNKKLEWLDLHNNTITDIHPSTFQNNRKMEHLDLSSNLLKVMHPDTFRHNVNLKFLSVRNNNILEIKTGFLSGINPTYLDLSGNRIRYLDNSVFRKQGQLETLLLSGNVFSSLEPGIFIDCTNLRNLSLSGNRISEISTSLFFGLVNLEHLDLSNNIIERLNTIVFHSFSTRTNPQVSTLKHLNLAQNQIQFFNFELYFPMSNNFYASYPTFQLDYLNVSSNRLTTLDVSSVKWLNQTTAVTDLTANPWNCDCSVLLEVWRGLKHKLTLHCASPRELQGKSWDEMEEFCCEVTEDMNCKSITSSEAVSSSPEHKDKNEVSVNVGSPSVVTTSLIVTGVLLVCAIGGGIVLVKVVKRRRNRPNSPEYCDVYAPRVSYVSIQSHAYVSSGSHYVSVQSDTAVGSDSRNEAEYSYVAVQ